MHAILAHGLLGPLDEIIYITIAGVFVGFMALSWIRSRNQPLDDEEQPAPTDEQPNNTPDHFKLD
jgi:hypothetical protein